MDEKAYRELGALLARPDELAVRPLVLYPLEIMGRRPRGAVEKIPVASFLLRDEGPAWDATLDLVEDQEGLDLFEAYKERHRADHPAPR